MGGYPEGGFSIEISRVEEAALELVGRAEENDVRGDLFFTF